MKKRLFVTVFILTVIFATGCKTEADKFYRVMYVGNGNTAGETPVDTKNYESGEKAIVMGKNTLEKNGYTFSRWNTNMNDSGDGFYPGDLIEINDRYIYFYAIWAKNP